MLSHFATVVPWKDAPESATRIQVLVFAYSETECNEVAAWDMPLEFTYQDLLRQMDAHRFVIITGGSYRYNSPEALEFPTSGEMPGIHISWEVVPMSEV